MQTVQTKQVVQLLCLLFLNCDLHLIKVCTPFPYSLVTFWHHIAKFYEVLLRSRYLAKQNRGVKFFEPVQISPTRQDVICVYRDADLEVRNVLCEQSKW